MQRTAILIKKFRLAYFSRGLSIMPANILKLPITRSACRRLASQATAAQAEAASPEIQCTVLPNKILVGSIDVCGGLSRLSVVFRTGSRNETYKNSGITHALRSVAGFSTANFTDFLILRNVQQLGAHFTCTGDREFTSYNLIGTRDNIFQLAGFFASSVSAPAFKPWQVSRNEPRLKYEVKTLDNQTKTIELLHKAAFRTGLGNPLFMKKYQIGSHSAEDLREYYYSGFTANRAAVVGYNLTHIDVVRFAESFTLPEGNPPPGSSTYYGGEIRKDRISYFTTVAIATEGTGSKDLKHALTYAVLQQALGSTPTTMWGGSPSPLYKGVSSVAPFAAASCLNMSYSDNGLFGVIIHGPSQNSGAALQAAFSILKSGQVSEADVKRGKALLRMKLLDESSNSGNLLEDIATQSLINGIVVPATVLAEAVDKISTSEVQNAAKKIASGKFSMAAVGNLSEIPYLDELK